MFHIRVDANVTIGIGHIMRCLSIAQEMRRQGEQVIFIVANTEAIEMIQKQNFPVVCLDTCWNDMESELATLLNYIREKKVERLLIDSYYVTSYYFETLKEYVEVIYIDDVDSFIYPVDKLVNYNIYASALDYEKRYQRGKLETSFALGCSFVPLRKEFSNVHRIVQDKVSKFLITSGGTDNYNVTNFILQALSKCSWFDDIECYVVVGQFNRNREELEKRWKDTLNVKLLFNVHDMVELMKQCDIAVTAGGVTVYELMACGLPSVMYTLADNQLSIAEHVSKRNLMTWVGDIRIDMEGCIFRMINCLEELYEDKLKRENISRLMQTTVDGKGCERLVRWLREG